MKRKLSTAPRKSIAPPRAKFTKHSERSDDEGEKPPIDENAQPGADTSSSVESETSETSGLSEWVAKRDADHARESNDPPL